MICFVSRKTSLAVATGSANLKSNAVQRPAAAVPRHGFSGLLKWLYSNVLTLNRVLYARLREAVVLSAKNAVQILRGVWITVRQHAMALDRTVTAAVLIILIAIQTTS